MSGKPKLDFWATSLAILLIATLGAARAQTINAVGIPSQSASAGLNTSGSDGHWAALFPSLGVFDYNSIVQAGDQGIVYSSGSIGTGAFVIAPWAAATSGLRINALGNVGIGTSSPLSLLDLSNQIAGTDSIRFSGLEFIYGQTSTNGVALRLGINRTSNRQLWIADSAAAVNTTNAQLRVMVGSGLGYSVVDSLSTDGTTPTNLSLNSNGGNVGIGTTSPSAKLEVNGTLRFSGDTAGTVQTTAWTGVLCGGDYAESVDVSGDRKHYEPGDVLVLSGDGDSDVTKSTEPYSTLVAGVFSTKPGVVGKRSPDAKDQIPMAMVGIVPAKVSAENGPIKKGDLLVSSSTPGHAMKGTDRSLLTGAVIGKAMGSLNSGTGVIQVLVTLQ